jgi:hypothetical protein
VVEGRQRKDRTHLAHAVGDRQNRWKNWHSGGHGFSFRFFQKVEMQTALRCYRRLRDDPLAIPPPIGEKVLGLLLRDLLGRQAARLPQEAPLRGVARPESRLEDAQLARDSARIDLNHFSDWQRRWISRVGYRLPVQLPTTPSSPLFFFPSITG